jgi:UPF0755 protein
MARDRARKPRRRRSRSGLLEIVNALLTLVVLGVLVGVGAFLYGANQFYAPGAVKADTRFEVPKGAGVGTVARLLDEQGIIVSSSPIPANLLFLGGSYLQKKQGEIKAGEFLLKADSSMADVLEEITEGKPISYAVVIPEGFTSWQVADRLNANNDLTGDPAAPPAEGAVLPSSYDYERGDTRAEVLARMEQKMAESLAEVFAACIPSVCGDKGVLHSPQDLVTLASVVEKETGVPSERPQVAAVFVNRLKKGMRLQSDPTIIYGITRGERKLDRPIRKSEIEARTPYNTYQVDGLPAGPIANPGIEALKAVADPADTNDLYFVAAGAVPSDGHLFSATYKEHEKNVAKYRKALKDAAQAEADAEAEQAKEALEAEQAEEIGQDGATDDATPAADTPAAQ